jgi:transposase
MPDICWQAKEQKGFDISHFRIALQKQQATCPMGKQSQKWYPDDELRSLRPSGL